MISYFSLYFQNLGTANFKELLSVATSYDKLKGTMTVVSIQLEYQIFTTLSHLFHMFIFQVLLTSGSTITSSWFRLVQIFVKIANSTIIHKYLRQTVVFM